MKYTRKGKEGLYARHYKDEVLRILHVMSADDTYAQRELFQSVWADYSIDNSTSNWIALDALTDDQIRQAVSPYIEQEPE